MRTHLAPGGPSGTVPTLVLQPSPRGAAAALPHEGLHAPQWSRRHRLWRPLLTVLGLDRHPGASVTEDSHFLSKNELAIDFQNELLYIF